MLALLVCVLATESFCRISCMDDKELMVHTRPSQSYLFGNAFKGRLVCMGKLLA